MHIMHNMFMANYVVDQNFVLDLQLIKRCIFWFENANKWNVEYPAEVVHEDLVKACKQKLKARLLLVKNSLNSFPSIKRLV